jgi:peptidoglycan/xylan/chitin deacetylase (PgdA/CDA1 family)
MKKIFLFVLLAVTGFSFDTPASTLQWIRINQLGYTPKGVKVAVWCSKTDVNLQSFELVDINTNKVVYKHIAGKPFGKYGPFTQTYRLNFSAFTKPGKYIIRAGNAASQPFSINDSVYKGAADFCLQYMRQQRSGFNPFLKDSCHTHDGFTVYAPVPDGTHIDVVGGWHDASDYLQYATTSANATYHLLASYRDFPKVFSDTRQANGLDGSNGIADVLDEAKWGLDWLLKMHPKDDWLFNQLGDDRDHKGMRIPKEDTNYYGRGLERPVYFCTGEPQVRGKFKNATTGVASTAGKFASAFALGAEIFSIKNISFADTLLNKSKSALRLGFEKPGVCQTASVLSPYIYAEENWVDDMELALASLNNYYRNKGDGRKVTLSGTNKENDKPSFLQQAKYYADKEPVTPWLGSDTAKHYQWYPFINLGHYELAKQLKFKQRDSIIGYYKQGIERVWSKAKNNAFYRSIPFIWCSNNLTVAFAMQCYWYRELTNDNTYIQLEQACFDWLFGCNPWGTSMVYGLPSWGDTPVDPHSAFTHLKNYPINGGLVDGPVYTSIYKGLIGIHLQHEDAYADFQSNLAVYHDDYGDYSTNEPTMDGTASLIYLLAAKENEASTRSKHIEVSHSAIVRGDSARKNIALVFTADELAEGLPVVTQTLQQQNIKASFFFTGRFYRNQQYQSQIKEMLKRGYYLGPHSDEHLLYCDWNKRDSLLVNEQQFKDDLQKNIESMKAIGINTSSIKYFIPPYEWWNDSIATWSQQQGLQLFSFSPGTRSNADYTWPEMGKAYMSSDAIIQNIKTFEQQHSMNGVILLIHPGTDVRRKDKLYNRLNELIEYLKQKGYHFKKMDELLG